MIIWVGRKRDEEAKAATGKHRHNCQAARTGKRHRFKQKMIAKEQYPYTITVLKTFNVAPLLLLAGSRTHRREPRFDA